MRTEGKPPVNLKRLVRIAELESEPAWLESYKAVSREEIETTHIAIRESLDGKNVDWMEKVGDEQYGR